MKRIIAIDVDLTIVDTLTPWIKWFINKTGIPFGKEDITQYYIGSLMKAKTKDYGIDGFDPNDYWRIPDLYDYLSPLYDAYEVINSLIDDGLDIVFVSKCYPEHIDSKKDFLMAHFGQVPFVSTSEKYMVRYDYFIDDHLNNIIAGESRNPDASHMLYTGVNSDTFGLGETHQIKIMNNWYDIKQHIVMCEHSRK